MICPRWLGNQIREDVVAARASGFIFILFKKNFFVCYRLIFMFSVLDLQASGQAALTFFTTGLKFISISGLFNC